MAAFPILPAPDTLWAPGSRQGGNMAGGQDLVIFMGQTLREPSGQLAPGSLLQLSGHTLENYLFTKAPGT